MWPALIISFGFLWVERRLFTLKASVARTESKLDMDDQFQSVFARMLALEGASKEVFDEKLRRQSNLLEGRLKRHENAVD